MASYTRFTTDVGTRRAPVSDITSFNGNKFSDYNVVVETIHDPMPEMREELVDRVCAHGSLVKGLYLNPREITLECRAFGNEWSDFDRVKAELAGFLYTNSDKRLVLRNHPDQYYMAHYNSMEEGDRDNCSCALTITLTASDPLRYDELQRVAIVSDGVKEFEIGGTDTPSMQIDVRRLGSGDGIEFWSAYNDLDAYCITPTRGNSFLIDCDTHTIRYNYDSTIVGTTLDTKWPVLTPGKWKVRVRNGAATLTWRQRYR